MRTVKDLPKLSFVCFQKTDVFHRFLENRRTEVKVLVNAGNTVSAGFLGLCLSGASKASSGDGPLGTGCCGVDLIAQYQKMQICAFLVPET